MKKQAIREFNKSLLSLVENLGLLVIGCHRVCDGGGNVSDDTRHAGHPDRFTFALSLSGSAGDGWAVLPIRQIAGAIPFVYRHGGTGGFFDSLRACTLPLSGR